MADKILAYYWSPYAPLEAEHVLVVFDTEDMEGSFLAFSPVSGICKMCPANLKTWHRITLQNFYEALGGVRFPQEFLRGVGSRVHDAERICREWTVRLRSGSVD